MSEKRFRHWATNFEWVHQGIGLFGGLTFFVGSIFFLFAGTIQHIGVWLFILGSAGMLVGNLGSFLVKYGRRELDL